MASRCGMRDWNYLRLAGSGMGRTGLGKGWELMMGVGRCILDENVGSWTGMRRSGNL